MSQLQALEILILELIGKHPTINNNYTLTRFFAKSTIPPYRLYTTLNGLVAQGYLSIKDIKNTINHYELTKKGFAELEQLDIFKHLEPFALYIDETGFISKIIYLLECQDNLAEVMDSFKLSDGRLIAFIQSRSGQLPAATVLENFQKRQWRIKQYLQVWGSIETYKKTEQEERENTFQYLLEGVGHAEKPEKGESLKILKFIG